MYTTELFYLLQELHIYILAHSKKTIEEQLSQKTNLKE